MAGSLFIVSRTKPGTYNYMKLVSESEHDVILDRRKVDRPQSISGRRLSAATASGATATL